MRWLVLFAVACTEPHYVSGHLHCAATGRACPEGFYCGAEGLCWQNGSGPELGAPDLGEDLATLAEDLSGVDFSGLDLSGLDLQTPDLARVFDLAGGDGPTATLCGASTAKICDSFEGALNARWSFNSPDGTASIDTSRAYRGSSSLHLHTNAKGSAVSEVQANLYTYDQLPVSGTLWVRAWVYMPSTASTHFNQIINFADAAGTGDAFTLKNGILVDNDYHGGNYNESATAYPPDQWFCVKMQIAQGGTGIHFYLGDNEVNDLAFPAASPAPMTHVYLGLDWFLMPAGTLAAQDAWIDELIIDDKPITCAM